MKNEKKQHGGIHNQEKHRQSGKPTEEEPWYLIFYHIRTVFSIPY
jgi:hypothetical protein